MLSAQLFLGFPIPHPFQEILDQANPYAVSLFINNDSDYLHKVEAGGLTYLGKKVGAKKDLETLYLTEANIYSLLKKLAPDFPSENYPLELFTVSE